MFPSNTVSQSVPKSFSTFRNLRRPHIYKSLTASIAALTITACALVTGCTSDGHPPEPAETLGGEWRVESIDQGGVIDRSMVTVAFDEKNRISGSTGCNRYAGSVELENGRFIASQVAMTKKACVPAISAQEQRFVTALKDAVRFDIESNTWLRAFDASGKERLKLIQMSAEPESASDIKGAKADQALEQFTTYNCGNSGTVKTRFLGPETLEVTAGNRTALLQRAKSASGTRYAGDKTWFWNKGELAALSMNGQEYNCRRAAS